MNRPLSKKNGLRFFKASARQSCVVAQARVSVEREMRTINGQIVLEQQRQQFIACASPGMTRVPEQSMMRNQQVGLRSDCQLHRRQVRVHGGGNASDGPLVFHLQTVCCAVPIVELAGAQHAVAISRDVGKTRCWHVRDQSKLYFLSKSKLGHSLHAFKLGQKNFTALLNSVTASL